MNSLPQADYQSSEPLNIRSRMQEKFSQRQVNWYRWVGETIHLKPSSRILDLGCGSGGYWLVNERLVSRQAAVLLDTSPAMLHECQLVLGDKQGRFSYLTADASNLPFHNRAFDVIIALGILDHIKEVPAALKMIRSAMKPDARLFACTAAEDHLIELCQLVSRYTGVVRLGSTSEAFTMDNGQQELRKVLKHVSVREFSDSLIFPDASSVMAYIASETSVLAALHGEAQPLEQHISQVIKESGPLIVRVHKVLFKAYD